MIGAIVGAVASIGGAVANGIMTAKSNKRLQEMRDKYFANAKADNQRWYEREYNTVATDRADAQAASTRMAEAIRDRNRQRQGTQAVMGGTEEAVQAGQAADAKAQADMMAQYAVANEARKDQVSQQYRQTKNQLDAAKVQADMQTEAQKSQNIANTTGQLISGAGQIAAGLSDMQTQRAKAMGGNDPNTHTGNVPQDSSAQGSVPIMLGMQRYFGDNKNA